MAKNNTKIEGLSGVLSLSTRNGMIWAAIRMAHLENPNRTLDEIAGAAQRIFEISDIPVSTLVRTYYRIEKVYLNNDKE